MRPDRTALACLGLLAGVALFGLLAPAWAHWTGHAYHETFPRTGLDPAGQPVPPNAEFWLGTDDLGRDVLVRAAYGARVSLLVGFSATVLATAAGVAVGLVSGFFGGLVDLLLARLLDVVLSFPYVLVAIALATTLGAHLGTTIAVIGFFSFAAVARTVRGQTLSLREREFVLAARALGAGPWRLMTREILPHLTAPVIILASLLLPAAIGFEATLSFLGAGVDPGTPSWGTMLGGAQEHYRSAWWLVLVPGGLLLATTVACNLLGDALNRTGR
ncbi:ABC transporter permease [Actinomadura craniellae]|uniref:ABC transporter permease n=1 Tax=Actinomadura craniellae TaxID=2231787 RepID=A0A365H6J0_9ACTN|nr:ABC transporter permease [Actinomadura craniellae]RAY14734.1 ABC transporter permease [Actinomadura craniellae]